MGKVPLVLTVQSLAGIRTAMVHGDAVRLYMPFVAVSCCVDLAAVSFRTWTGARL